MYGKFFRDEWIALITFIGLSVSAVQLDIFDRVFEMTREYEHLELDEYLVVFLIFFFIASVYALKKFMMLNHKKELLLHSFSFDKLTGLKNREAFLQHMHQSPKDYVVLLNLINFKMINKTVGLRKADRILKKIASKLNKIVTTHAGVQLFRVYGDEFAMVIGKNENVGDICCSIQTSFEQYAVKFLGNKFHFSLHMAYSKTEPRFLTAMLTMEEIKKSLDSHILCFNSAYHNLEQNKETMKMVRIIKNAIANDQLLPVYHSIVDNQTQEVIKYEALARIRQNDNELLSPFFFIELSKKFKLYPFITKTIIEKAFRDFENESCCFSINFSFIDIHNKQILEFFYAKLEEHKDVAKRLTIEILETENIDNYDELLFFREKIKEYGCSLAIDDFGSGYSNWVNVLSLRPDFIKIDGSLIQNLTQNKQSVNLVRTIISFAQSNGIKTIAEFVCNKELFDIVKDLGIDYSQGYFFSQPQIYSALKQPIESKNNA